MAGTLSPEAVQSVRGIVGWLAFFGLVGSVAAIIAGGVMVYFGSTGSSDIKIFGQSISTTNVGVPCVFLGIICLIMVVRRAFNTLDRALAAT